MMFSMVLLLAIVISRQHVSHITWQCGTAIIVYYDNAFLSLMGKSILLSYHGLYRYQI